MTPKLLPKTDKNDKKTKIEKENLPESEGKLEIKSRHIALNVFLAI